MLFIKQFDTTICSINIKSILSENIKIKIHSIFNNSVNLILENDLLINIIAENKGITPYSMCMLSKNLNSIIKTLYIKDSIAFNKDSNSLIIKDTYKINIKSDYVYDPQIKFEHYNANMLENNINLVKKIIKINPNWRFGLEDENLQLKINNLIIQLKKDTQNIICCLDYFIGRGQGLTPTGDDFIVGLLSLLIISNKIKLENNLYALKNNFYNKTTRISYEFLNYAFLGHFSSVIKNFLLCLLSNDESKLVSSLYTLCNTGHTSGFDSIYGILTAYEIIKE